MYTKRDILYRLAHGKYDKKTKQTIRVLLVVPNASFSVHIWKFSMLNYILVIHNMIDIVIIDIVIFNEVTFYICSIVCFDKIQYTFCT